MLQFRSIINTCIGAIWLVNGLYCKLLLQVPRHREIVARILGPDHATSLIRLIGLGEIVICIWVFSRYKARLCAMVQALLVIVMNMIELTCARDLLLFGWVNGLLAALLVIAILFNGLTHNSKQANIS